MPRIYITLLATVLSLPSAAHAEVDFQACLAALRTKAADAGYARTTLETAFADIQQRDRVLVSDRQQPEFFYTFWQYLETRVTIERVARGRELLQQHGRLLNGIHRDFGIRPEFLLAFWGLETNFGRYFGDIPVLDSLATLACDPRRSDFFTTQFMNALRILERGEMQANQMRGSWAGAMGHTQFMPSVYNSYAVDYDGDGKRDLWNSLPDAFASSANYLHTIGWRDGERWGREVLIPERFNWELTGLDIRKPLHEWRRLGLKTVWGEPLPVANMEASLLAPAGHRGPVFLVYDNFRIIMRWNYSISYALAVGYLADRIAGMGQLAAQPPTQIRLLSADDIREIQSHLNTLGYSSGEADGVVGHKTRNAIKDFQLQHGMPADGYPDHNLLQRLRRAGSG